MPAYLVLLRRTPPLWTQTTSTATIAAVPLGGRALGRDLVTAFGASLITVSAVADTAVIAAACGATVLGGWLAAHM